MRDIDLRAVGRRMKSSRQAANLTQRDVAKAMEMTQQAVSAWERGERSPATGQWMNLAYLYGAGLDLMIMDVKSVPVRFVQMWMESETAREPWMRNAWKELMLMYLNGGADFTSPPPEPPATI